MKETVVPSTEIAVLFTKQLALLRVVAISVAFLLWCFVSLLMLVLYLHGLISVPALEQSLQFLSLVGLAPLVVAVAAWRAIEKVISFYVTSYARSHIQR